MPLKFKKMVGAFFTTTREQKIGQPDPFLSILKFSLKKGEIRDSQY